MEQLKRDFKGVWVPKEIWLNRELNVLNKTILIGIYTLSEDGSCTASNKEIAEFCMCCERSVSSSIARLIKNGFIKKESFDGRTRVLKVMEG